MRVEAHPEHSHRGNRPCHCERLGQLNSVPGHRFDNRVREGSSEGAREGEAMRGNGKIVDVPAFSELGCHTPEPLYSGF